MAAVNKLLQTMGSLAPGGTPTSSQPRNWNFLKIPMQTYKYTNAQFWPGGGSTRDETLL